MPVRIPKIGSTLSREEIKNIELFARSCRRTIIEMTTEAQSGHPGGSLSSIDYLSLLYTCIISHTNDPVVISNGHISPAIYALLAELGTVPKKDVIDNFRKIGSQFEGHVSRQVPGVWYSTGPLGAGISAASGFALAQKLQSQKGNSSTSIRIKKVFATIGDGESQEGQVYEMMNFAAKYELSNLIVFLDYNQVQLSGGLKKIMPLRPAALFAAAGWEVISVDGHNIKKMWKALSRAYTIKNKPVIIIGHTVMGRDVSFMEQEGKKFQATWHGKAASEEEAQKALSELTFTPKEEQILNNFKKQLKFQTEKPKFLKSLTKLPIKIGKPQTYSPKEMLDCRSAYGNALLDLAKLNKNIIALTADLSVSVKTDLLKAKFPERHIECGVAEQQMVSCAGGLSLSGYIPFVSTFGAFMTSRAKDQARVNDINQTNVKMVATHCGLSVGEDGPTHQAVDDMGSMLGLFHTMELEPADPNQTDHMIRYIASHYGNFYMRMGRHKIPVLTKENGTPFFDAKYKYTYGRCDRLREGNDLTLAVNGSMVYQALEAYSELKLQNIHVEIIIVSSIKQFDATLKKSLQKTKRLLTVEDHNTKSGLASQLALYLQKEKIVLQKFDIMGVDEYQTSGTAEELYERAKISPNYIIKKCEAML